jgi:ribosomal-protein-alanine N-acetyltransferase
MKAIETERLLLRDLAASDRHPVHEYASDPEVVRFMDWGPNTEEETNEFIERSILSQRKSLDATLVLLSY